MKARAAPDLPAFVGRPMAAIFGQRGGVEDVLQKNQTRARGNSRSSRWRRQEPLTEEKSPTSSRCTKPKGPLENRVAEAFCVQDISTRVSEARSSRVRSKRSHVHDPRGQSQLMLPFSCLIIRNLHPGFGLKCHQRFFRIHHALLCKTQHPPCVIEESILLHPKWNKAIVNAEKSIGYYTTSYFGLKWLMTEELASVAGHLRKLADSNHPIVQVAKRLANFTSVEKQALVHPRGLIVLLLAKAAGSMAPTVVGESEKFTGISKKQRELAEMTEMIHCAFLIHQCLVDERVLVSNQELATIKFGNRLAILSGDFLLAVVMKGLAEFKNHQVVALMASAIESFVSGFFLSQYEHPDIKDINFESTCIKTFWQERISFLTPSLLGFACQSALALAGHSSEKQEMANSFGKNFALAWMAFTELCQFTRPYDPNFIVSRSGLPVLLYMKSQANCQLPTNDVDLHDLISNNQEVLDATFDCVTQYKTAAVESLKVFNPSSESVNALVGLLNVFDHPVLRKL